MPIIAKSLEKYHARKKAKPEIIFYQIVNKFVLLSKPLPPTMPLNIAKSLEGEDTHRNIACDSKTCISHTTPQ